MVPRNGDINKDAIHTLRSSVILYFSQTLQDSSEGGRQISAFWVPLDYF